METKIRICLTLLDFGPKVGRNPFHPTPSRGPRPPGGCLRPPGCCLGVPMGWFDDGFEYQMHMSKQTYQLTQKQTNKQTQTNHLCFKSVLHRWRCGDSFDDGFEFQILRFFFINAVSLLHHREKVLLQLLVQKRLVSSHLLHSLLRQRQRRGHGGSGGGGGG